MGSWDSIESRGPPDVIGEQSGDAPSHHWPTPCWSPWQQQPPTLLDWVGNTHSCLAGSFGGGGCKILLTEELSLKIFHKTNSPWKIKKNINTGQFNCAIPHNISIKLPPHTACQTKQMLTWRLRQPACHKLHAKLLTCRLTVTFLHVPRCPFVNWTRHEINHLRGCLTLSTMSTKYMVNVWYKNNFGVCPAGKTYHTHYSILPLTEIISSGTIENFWVWIPSRRIARGKPFVDISRPKAWDILVRDIEHHSTYIPPSIFRIWSSTIGIHSHDHTQVPKWQIYPHQQPSS